MGRSANRKASKGARRPTDVGDWTPVGPALADGGTARYRFATGTEDRRIDRFPERELGRVSAWIRPPGSTQWSPVELADFSSIGFGVHWTPAPEAQQGQADPMLTRPAIPPRFPALKVGDEAEFRLKVWGHGEFTTWCEVRNVGPWKKGLKIGLRRLDVATPQAVSEERREALRLVLSPALSLNARVRHPLRFGHWSQLAVSDLNRDMGFSFQTSDPSILLFEGMELKIHFELSGLRSEPMHARVAWVYASSPDTVRFGVTCLGIDFRLHDALCDFLLSSQCWSPDRLRLAGFLGKRVKSHLRFGTVKSMDDYAEVLHLRRDAYVGVGKRPAGTRPEKMSSPLDGRSRIFMARHHGKLVATLTFTFPASEDTLLDTQAGFPGNRYPVPLPPKTNIIEVSRLCIDESYRGTDVLVGMFEYGLKHFLLSDRHWLLTSATDELFPLYERIGFVKLKASYKHPLLNQQVHHLIIAHRSAFLWGFGMGNLVWNSVFGDLVRHLIGRSFISVPWWVRCLIEAKLLLRPLARKLIDGKARRAFQKHFAALRAKSSRGGRPPAAGTPRTDPTGSLHQPVEVEAPGTGRKPG